MSNTEIKPKHGYAFKTRGAYAIERGWLLEWVVQQFEGNKAFPTKEVAGLDPYPDDDEPVAKEMVDNHICSGGWINEHGENWDLVNYTDTELQAAKGEPWPRKNVASGEVFEMDWTYSTPHPTRGYNYWITRDGWNPEERIKVDQLEPAPFAKHHYNPRLEYGEAPLKTSVVLPKKKGYHVMIAAWIVADTGNAFYQTFDLEFESDGGTEPPTGINLESPADGSNFQAPASVQLKAKLEGGSQGVSHVRFFHGGTKIQDVYLPEPDGLTYVYNWENLQAGNYQSIRAVVFLDGNVRGPESQVISFLVSESGTPTAVKFTSPIENQEFFTQNSIPLRINLIGGTAGIDFVRFFYGGTKIEDVREAPYSYDWSHAVPGAYLLRVLVILKNGTRLPEDQVNIRINA